MILIGSTRFIRIESKIHLWHKICWKKIQVLFKDGRGGTSITTQVYRLYRHCMHALSVRMSLYDQTLPSSP